MEGIVTGPMERRVFKLVKLDTPRGMDLLHAMARKIDELEAEVKRLKQSLVSG